MIGKPHHSTSNPTAYTSPWDSYTDPTAEIFPSSSSLSPLSVTTQTTVTNGNASPSCHYLLSSYDALLTALSRYLPSNEPKLAVTDSEPTDAVTIDSDDFRMYEFKVRRCTRPKAHDWTECPFAHPGEKARRRDPRRYSYSGTACTDFRKGGCRRGDACDFAHGVFECWLHPTRYRTQACKDGPNCTRRVCFFAHSAGQIRVVSGQPSPISIGSGSPDPFEESPPLTPVGRAYGPGTVGELAATLRNLQLSKVKSIPTGLVSPRFGSSVGKAVRTGFYSMPTTPTRMVGGVGYLDGWEEDPVMERPMWEKLRDENRVDMQEPGDENPGGSGPDIGWVSELVK